MARAIRLLAAASGAFCFVQSAHGADPYSAIRQDIAREIAVGRATGVAVALTQNGKIIWQEGFGWADKERGRRATPDTPFSLASVTKPFTTTALMVLVAAKKVSLDARANDYLGAAKIRAGVGNPNDVTVRAVASHSSGLPGTFQLFPVGGPRKQPSMDDVIREYGVLVSPPNERYHYSNVGMGIVAHIVSRKSGLDFGEFLHRKVLEPLGLSLHDGDKVVPLTLSISEAESTLCIQGQKPEPISDLGLVEGMMQGKTRGDLGLPATRAAKAVGLSLRLQLRRSKLEGEIGAPIAYAREPDHLPFWAEFSRVDPNNPDQ